MVKLEGTEKQVEWGNKIRNELLSGTKVIELAKEQFENINENCKKVIDICIDFKNRLETETSAKWFIEHKNYVHSTLANNYNRNELSLHSIVWEATNDEKLERLASKIENRVKY